jgi:hypothetical protein
MKRGEERVDIKVIPHTRREDKSKRNSIFYEIKFLFHFVNFDFRRNCDNINSKICMVQGKWRSSLLMQDIIM